MTNEGGCEKVDEPALVLVTNVVDGTQALTTALATAVSTAA